MPIEVKSGKDHKRHRAFNNVMSTPNYGRREAMVLYEGNLEVADNVIYAPIYMVAAL